MMMSSSDSLVYTVVRLSSKLGTFSRKGIWFVSDSEEPVPSLSCPGSWADVGPTLATVTWGT